MKVLRIANTIAHNIIHSKKNPFKRRPFEQNNTNICRKKCRIMSHHKTTFVL